MGIWLFDTNNRLLDVASALATVIGLVIVVFQQIRSRRLLELQTRPYVYISCRKVTRDGKSMVVLDIRNTGKTPAFDLTIEAMGTAPFHELNGSSKLPFVNQQATLNVLPGQRLTYLIGAGDKKSNFPLAQGQEVSVAVNYRGDKRGKTYTDEVVLTLSTSSFLVESVF